MEKKNLAKEYATARLQGRLSGNEIQFNGHEVFTETDIENAFNAGRESVVDNIPELEWEEALYDGETYWLAKPIGDIYRVLFMQHEYEVFCCHDFIARAISLSSAKQAANDDYKQRILKALG